MRPFIADAGAQDAARHRRIDRGGGRHHFAREFGLQGTLIDPAPLEVEQARAFGLETITGLVEEHDFGEPPVRRRADLPDGRSSARRGRHARPACANCCHDDGLLFIDIVDFRAAYLRNWSVEDAIKIDHPYYLTRADHGAYLSGLDSNLADATTRRIICTSATSAVPAPRTSDLMPTAVGRRAVPRDPLRPERLAQGGR